MTPSTSTMPTGPVRDRAYWTRVIHNAAKVTPEHPRYGEARQVVQLALENLGALQQGKNAADTPAPVVPSNMRGIAMNALQGLTLGTGDEALGGIAGLGTLLTGGSMDQAANRVQQTTEGFRDQRGAFFGQHPYLAVGSDIAGTAVNPLNKILGPMTEALGPVAKGAVYGMTLGAARGFGEGTGSAKERLPSAALGAAVGLISGTALGKAVKIVGPTLGKIVQTARRSLGPNAAPSEITNAVETSIRARLTKLNVAPEDIERAIESWKATGELSVRRLAETHPPPLPQPTIRPGETIQQIAPKGFAVTGARATPQGPFPPTISELQGLGTGQTLPYYTRGGAAEQAMAPFPTASPPQPKSMVQGQTDILAQFLQGATPQDLPGRLATMRGMGIQLPPDAQTQLLQILLGVSR